MRAPWPACFPALRGLHIQLAWHNALSAWKHAVLLQAQHWVVSEARHSQVPGCKACNVLDAQDITELTEQPKTARDKADRGGDDAT